MRLPEIIFEDETILVLNKPAGIVVNQALTTKNQITVEDWLRQRQKQPLERSGIVHRLDKETSGLLLAAKTSAAMANLQSQFKDRRVEKTYLALVHGQVMPQTDTIDLPICRNPFNRQRFGVFVGGRPAITSYEVTAYFSKNDLSLVRVRPRTGRTHQIRVHFKYRNHALVSDGLYCGRKTANQDRGWCPRLFLHASEIGFFHPVSSKKVEYKAELAPELSRVLENLKKD